MTTFDCFMFRNEFEILEIRLNELNDVVDYFVISEAEFTHSGKPKPLFLKEKLSSPSIFDQFRDKIVLVRSLLDPRLHSWVNENQQRMDLQRGIVGHPAFDDKNDLILVSDADEIPSVDFVKSTKHIFDSTPETSPILNQQYFYYYTFRYRKKELCHGTVALTSKMLSQFNLQTCRDHRFSYPTWRIPHLLGWHMSFFGGPENVKEKIESFAHVEFGHMNDLEKIKNNIETGQDVFGRQGELDVLVEIPDNQDVPWYVKSNKHKYLHLF